MRSKASSALGSVLFFLIAPGTVAGYVPYLLTRWRFEPPLLGISTGRWIGGFLVATGLVGLVECFARFALEGRGTPAPVAPPTTLVVSGPYRHVRNPMYVSVLAILVGQALLFGSVRVLEYAGGAWLATHLFVLGYEEPTLRRQFGASYDTYRANVGRWLPRLRPWSNGTPGIRPGAD
jgi:protein-S-isoprenylcysteine O-methyltransferase Ste14